MGTGTRRVVLTGGIGSGKSTAARLMADRGAIVIDADRIGHDLLEPGAAGFDPVARRWPEVVDGDGRIDRRLLGRIVFANTLELEELEAILHHLIRSEIARKIDQVPADALLVVELSVPAPILGDGWYTVVVDTPDDVRIERLIARGMDAGEVEQRMARQPGRSAWLAMADEVLSNDGSAIGLARRVDELMAKLRA
jgi:dephospho-CoA kinase